MTAGKTLIRIDEHTLSPVITYELFVDSPLIVQTMPAQDPRRSVIHPIQK